MPIGLQSGFSRPSKAAWPLVGCLPRAAAVAATTLGLVLPALQAGCVRPRPAVQELPEHLPGTWLRVSFERARNAEACSGRAPDRIAALLQPAQVLQKAVDLPPVDKPQLQRLAHDELQSQGVELQAITSPE